MERSIGRCSGRGDSGASSWISRTGGSAGAGGVGAGGADAAGIGIGGVGIDGAAGFDFERSQSSGPGAGSLAVAGKRGS